MYQVFARVDADNRITAVNSSAFLPSVAGWVLLDEGEGDRYHHAQGNYFPASLMDEGGVCRYAYVADAEAGAEKWRERTTAEMDADAVPPMTPTDPVDVLAGRVDAVELTTDDLVLMMAELIGGA